jgi:hypothetical protein
MRKKPVTQDAQLLLQLDRLQKESEMRKARLWWRDRFWPQNAADYIKIEMAHGSRESDWLRQVTSFWGLAASLVLDGTLSERAFFNPTFSKELFTVFSKVKPFLKELRRRTNNPDFMANVERVILKSKSAGDRLRLESERLADRRKKRA